MAVDLQKQDKSVRTVHRWKIRRLVCMFSWECGIIFKNEALGTDLVTKKKLTSSQSGTKGQKVYFTQEKHAVEVRRHDHIALRIFFVLKYILSDINQATLLS